MYGGMWHFGLGWMWIFWVLLVAGIAWVALRIARRDGGRSGSPEQILRSRYARGEIEREEYERRLADIRR